MSNNMRLTRALGKQQGRTLAGITLRVIHVAFSIALSSQCNAASQSDKIDAAPKTIRESTQASPPGQLNRPPSEDTRVRETKAIDGHVLINPYQVLADQKQARQKFQELHQERLWAIAELDQQRTELNRLLGEPHHRPVPVPVITEANYNARVSDIDSKIRGYEAQQNNSDLTETQKAEAHAQLLDLTRQKARAALELISYRNAMQELTTFNEATTREETARLITATTSSYLSNIDGAISDLMMSNDTESNFRLADWLLFYLRFQEWLHEGDF
jgi:hypothetical protein